MTNVVQLTPVPPKQFERRYRGHRISVKYDKKHQTFIWQFVHATSMHLRGVCPSAKEAELEAKKEIDKLIDRPEV